MRFAGAERRLAVSVEDATARVQAAVEKLPVLRDDLGPSPPEGGAPTLGDGFPSVVVVRCNSE
jgi:hypothetical protein